jgi:hypothetical protein
MCMGIIILHKCRIRTHRHGLIIVQKVGGFLMCDAAVEESSPMTAASEILAGEAGVGAAANLDGEAEVAVVRG